jgi:tRNA(fMet)-specific endonuclease VapC
VGKLIDSSVLVATERRRLDLDAVIAPYREEEFAISAITAAELLHGMHRAERVQRRVERERFVEGILERFPVLPFDLRVARLHAALWADLAARGVGVGERDLLIGATALAYGYEVVTRDQRSFPRIPGLALVRW